MIPCPECGHENLDGLEYCDACGAKLQSQAEAAVAAGNVDKATRLLGNAIAGTQRLGNTKATQALVSLQNEIKKTQSLAGRAAKTQLLTAQATLRKTQLLDPESVKDVLRDSANE